MSGNLGGFKLLRPPRAFIHPPEQPHNQQSLFYQYSFMEKNGRWPTWEDALKHCTAEVREVWVAALAERGVIVPTEDPAS